MNRERVHGVGLTPILIFAAAVFHAAVMSAELTPRSLQQRIDNARIGDSLYVERGTYMGNVHIDRRIHLIGLNHPLIRGTSVGSAVIITADSCTLRGFTIEHCGAMLADEDAGILIKSSHNTIERNILRDVLFGIYLYRAEFNSVNDNTIAGRKELDLGQRGSGIHIWNSNNNTFIGNSITDARDGFYIQYANHTRIERNEAHALRYGLHYMYADSNVFLENRFYDNLAGAAIMYSRSILIRRNTFLHNRGFTSFGILFQDCHDSQIDSNIIADNVTGLFLEASTDNLLRHNLIAQNDVALQIFQNSTANTFAENNFIDNLNPLFLVGKRTECRWFLGPKGNYWSNYDGYDLDGDGIGDVPMKIQNVFQYLEARNDYLRLYLYSPAAQALAAATRAFPVIAINNEADDKPLIRPVPLDFAVRLARPHTEVPREVTLSSGGLLMAPLAGLFAAGLFFILTLRRTHS